MPSDHSWKPLACDRSDGNADVPKKGSVVLLLGLGYTETVNLVQAQDLSLAFSGAPVLDNAQLIIEMGERVCLVGRNGEGKSCLMRILMGDMDPDGGQVRRHPDARVAYLPQEVPDTLTGTAHEVVLAGLGDLLLWCAFCC